MTRTSVPEYGITPTVRTSVSRMTFGNITDRVISRKTRCILELLNQKGTLPKKSLILGAYLTGSGVANGLVGESDVTVMDIYPHLRSLLHPAVSFVSCTEDIIEQEWDFVLDATGIGGCNPDILAAIRCCGPFIIEDPASDGSDSLIRQKRRCRDILSRVHAPRKGILRTCGLRSKTSGTMTLSLDVLRYSMHAAIREEGVLYATAPMEFAERILFKEQDPVHFFESLNRPALTVSALREITCDTYLENTLDRIHSQITYCKGGVLNESSGIFRNCGGKNPLGTVLGGRSGWFYRPG